MKAHVKGEPAAAGSNDLKDSNSDDEAYNNESNMDTSGADSDDSAISVKENEANVKTDQK